MNSWRAGHILLLWLGTACLAAALVLLESQRHSHFFWLVHVTGRIRDLPRGLAVAFAAFPFAAIGLVLLPTLAVVLTAWWVGIVVRGRTSRPSI